MDLGAFSMSLAVSDLARSRAFYEALGFSATGGDETTWVIMRNGETMIGLFQGLFAGNILTFNPGLAQDMTRLAEYTDVREIQRSLRAAGIEPVEAVDELGRGPGHIALADPDGNAILIDQFDGG